MTDKEIIQAFKSNDQRGIRQAYIAWRVPFSDYISFKLRFDTDYMDDIYHESILRLQQHILTGRLIAENITASLQAYLNQVGYNVAREFIRARKELPVSQISNEPNDNQETIDETLPEDTELLDELKQGSVDPMDKYFVEERERIIREEIQNLGKPCAPLLVGFYWANKTMDILAAELGYSNADSAKAQKAKCMKKVLTYVKSRLINYGYGY